MDALEYTESVVGVTLERAIEAYDTVLDNVFKFATILAGGAGGAGVYFLSKLGPDALKFAPVGALSIWWFLIAGVVLLRGAKSNSLTLGPKSESVRTRLAKHTPSEGEDPAFIALWLTRWDNLVSMDSQIDAYSEAITRRSKILDGAYWCVAGSPLVAGLALLLTLGRP